MTVTEPRPGDAQPWHLSGNFAPIEDEATLTDLEVVGVIPPALDGLFVRNGPNPRSGKSPHWFLGNGMLHGVRLRDGRAQWYRNRYVRTGRFEDPDLAFVSDTGEVDRVHSSAANTHVICHADRILALEEGHVPWEVDATLETVGPVTFDGQLATAFTAHPKRCPETGELLAFGYGFFPPFLTYHRVSADGRLVQSTDIAVPGPTMIHDFNVTRHHVVFMDLPVVFDFDLALQGTMPYRWSDTYGARLGVMPREGTADQVRWYEVDPCYVFHPMNAYEDGERIVLDVCRYETLWRSGPEEFTASYLHRWTIDPATGTVAEERLDDRTVEFSRVADANVGLPYRYGYAVLTRPTNGVVDFQTTLVKYDHLSGTQVEHLEGAGRRPGEGVFAADPDGTAEDDGWVVTFVHDQATDMSDLIILDARDMGAGPVATVKLPRRVPFGFHGSWVPASEHPGLR
jgi:carotenoid cleavage dioxygenase